MRLAFDRCVAVRKKRRRTKLEKYVEVLCLIGWGVKEPVHIMRRTNLLWGGLADYIKALTKRGLIAIRESGGLKGYELTDEGYHTLYQFLRLIHVSKLRGIPP